ncbi:hypothetical protein ACSU64_06435 [Bacillaceae bacterium C204]|uniref:hypothetical protein n=1 Tax=Neobacillus sp. 204 TaxID=3383351 RepID=UPI00397DB8B9
MSKLEFLEISRNFKSYYRTLRDIHYYLSNDSELNQEELQAVSKVLSKLIYGFIRIKGTFFREMDREQFEQEFNLFHQDFLNVIQNSGENNVDFDQFTALVDELIGIAYKRTNTLGKIKKVKQVWSFDDDEIAEITDDESQSGNEDEDNFTFDKVVDEVVVDVSEVNDEIKEVVVDVNEVNDEIKEVVPEVKTISNEVKTFSTNLKTFDSNFKTFSTDVKIFSTDVETLSNEVEVVLDQITNAEAKQPKPENKVVVSDVANKVEEAPKTPKKVKHNFVDAAPIVNKYNDYESSDNFRFRPRRKKNR